MSKKFLIAVDGSDHAWKAVDPATDLAIVSDAELVILHVVPYEPMPEGFQEFAKIEGVPVEEMGGRYHYSRAIGDKIQAQPRHVYKRKALLGDGAWHA